MHRFYFNECLPSNDDLHRFVDLLSTTVLEFDSLKKACSSISPEVVTEKLTSSMIVCGQYSLAEILQKIENRDLRTIAFSIFDKSYPINVHFKEDETMIDDIWRHKYQLVHGEEVSDATNLAIVAKNNGLLFSVPLHKSLAADTVNLQSSLSQDTTLSLVNLYGSAINTHYVSKHVRDIDALSLTKLEQLQHILGQYRFTSTFEKDFRSLSSAEQESIIEHFTRAKARHLITPFQSDNSLIKDVTPQNGKLNVFELRIFHPTALRVYFHEHEGTIFIAGVEHKSNPDQNSDIIKAAKILYRLTLA
jgi:putative component of toxin-antitoxin plasmid stabilization module